MEMARTWFPDNKDAAQAVVLSMYDVEETMAYAEGQDVNDEEQNVLDVARGGMRLRADLCIELLEAPPLSLANPCGRRCYTWTVPPRWEPITKDMLKEVDDEESADFANFEDDEAAPGVTDEQWALLTLVRISPPRPRWPSSHCRGERSSLQKEGCGASFCPRDRSQGQPSDIDGVGQPRGRGPQAASRGGRGTRAVPVGGT
jgi:hypothetical protein